MKKVKLNPNSDYHNILIKKFGREKAVQVLERVFQTPFNFSRQSGEQIRTYAKLHLQTR